ncbi:MFS transporter [Sphingomonas sp. Tas61C01]|uniref:MFS transporter n=1 Tax=Sphingomonas sp. Tas61C01 TaxID=3458297 RepID=UPI00403ECAB2
MRALERFSKAEIVAVLTVGIVGVLIAGLQPQLLGALAADGRLSVGALGNLATVELLAMGVAAGVAGFVLPIGKVRLVAALAIIATAACDVLTARAGAPALFAARIGAGVAEGVLIWVAIGMIVRTANPARWSGIYLMTQTLAQLVVATAFGFAILPRFGSTGGFVALGLFSLAALIALLWLPAAYAPLTDADGHEEAADGRPSARGVLALIGVVLFLAFEVAVWVYVEPLAHEQGVSPGAIAAIAPLSLAMQVLGAGAASILAGRLPSFPTLLAASAGSLIVLAVMGVTTAPAIFVTATAAFGFLWLFAMPFQVPLVIAADPTRRAAALVGGAQLVGSSAGPFLASLLVHDDRVGMVLWFGAGCIVVSLAFTMISQQRAAFRD